MALEPELIFLDEPSAGLDPVSAAELDELILTLNAALGLTVVVVTHEPREHLQDRQALHHARPREQEHHRARRPARAPRQQRGPARPRISSTAVTRRSRMSAPRPTTGSSALFVVGSVLVGLIAPWSCSARERCSARRFATSPTSTSRSRARGGLAGEVPRRDDRQRLGDRRRARSAARGVTLRARRQVLARLGSPRTSQAARRAIYRPADLRVQIASTG